MELGATVCLPRAPRCGECPLSAICEARRLGSAAQLPVKARKARTVKIAMAVAVIVRRGRLLLWQRTERTRMSGFWELPATDQLPAAGSLRLAGAFRHTIMNHQYQVTVHVGEVPPKSRIRTPLQWVPMDKLPSLPLSTVTRKTLRLTAIMQVD